MSAWTALTLGTNITATVSTGDFEPEERTFAGKLELHGAVIAGGSISADATLLTIATVASRPSKLGRFTVEFGVAGANTTGTLTVNTNGTITLDEALASSDVLSLDGILIDLA